MILNRKYYFYRNILSSLFNSVKSISTLLGAKIFPNEIVESKNVFIGPPFLAIHPDRTLVCTSCNKCEAICPTNCISVDKQENKKAPNQFLIDISNCIYCGLCEEVCPDNAIYMSNELPPVFSEQIEPSFWKWDIEKLAFRKTLNQGKGIVLKDDQLQYQND